MTIILVLTCTPWISGISRYAAEVISWRVTGNVWNLRQSTYILLSFSGLRMWVSIIRASRVLKSSSSRTGRAKIPGITPDNITREVTLERIFWVGERIRIWAMAVRGSNLKFSVGSLWDQLRDAGAETSILIPRWAEFHGHQGRAGQVDSDILILGDFP